VNPSHPIGDVEDQELQQAKKTIVVLCFFNLLLMCVGAAGTIYEMMAGEDKSKIYSEFARNRLIRKREKWSEFNEKLSDRLFYRCFRMTRPLFNKLCNRIEHAVGRKQFKSEAYIEELKKQGYTTKESRMYQAALKTTGDYVSGETKVAMTLRLLAGGSYLDVFLWSGCHPDYVRCVSRSVKQDWFCNEDVMSINYYKFLQDSADIDRVRA
jgi:hypothetical protein